MKTRIFFFAFLTLTGRQAFSQVNVSNVNVNIQCCTAGMQFIPVGSNQMVAEFFTNGTGVTTFSLVPKIQSALLVNAQSVATGQWPDPVYTTECTVAERSSGGVWQGSFVPGSTGKHYAMFAIINNPGDTNFGWMEMNFGSDTSITTERVAYNTVKNTRLRASQTGPNTSVIDMAEAKQPVHFYPQPAKDKVTLENQLETALQAEILNYSGQVVSVTAIPPGGKTEISVQAFAPGIYMIRCTGAEQLFVQKLLVMY